MLYYFQKQGVTMETIKISYQKQIYKLTPQKVFHILSILENKKCEHLSNEKVIKLLKKYKLLNDIFLNNINNI